MLFLQLTPEKPAMGAVVYLEDFRRTRATSASPDLSNFWFHWPMSALDAWLKACNGYLSPPGQVIPFVRANDLVRSHIAGPA